MVSHFQQEKDAKNKKKAILFEQQNGECCWCKKKMRLFFGAKAKAIMDLPNEYRHDVATLEHINAKTPCSRRRMNHKEYGGKLKLACLECNTMQKRGNHKRASSRAK